MQRSNWDKDELSERQIRYAATDAWVSLRVFEEMRRSVVVSINLKYPEVSLIL